MEGQTGDLEENLLSRKEAREREVGRGRKHKKDIKEKSKALPTHAERKCRDRKYRGATSC